MGDSAGMLAAMRGDQIERDAYLERISLRAMVQQHITCQLTGAVLDIRRAVVVTLRRETGEEAACVVMTADAYDNEGGAANVERTIATMAQRGVVLVPEIIDGRWWTSKGTLTVSQRHVREAAAIEAAEREQATAKDAADRAEAERH